MNDVTAQPAVDLPLPAGPWTNQSFFIPARHEWARTSPRQPRFDWGPSPAANRLTSRGRGRLVARATLQRRGMIDMVVDSRVGLQAHISQWIWTRDAERRTSLCGRSRGRARGRGSRRGDVSRTCCRASRRARVLLEQRDEDEPQLSGSVAELD
eukprot:7458497-Pyramimonas_sp.AAC.1